MKICRSLIFSPFPSAKSFPDNSVDKESTCNAGDHGSIPGLGRSAGERIRYLLQYSWAFLVAQLVKNSPAMWETWVQSLGWEDPLENEKATHSSILAWTYTVHGFSKSQTRLSDFHFTSKNILSLRFLSLSLRPVVPAGWASVAVFVLPGSSVATDETRSGMISSTRKPIWAQP